MRSPILAMVWEQWRITRVEMAFRFGLSLAFGTVLMTFGPASPGAAAGSSDGAVLALFFGAFFHSLLSLSLSKLNGGRFLDGYHPGFPLHLLYTRPLRTSTIVGVSMAFAALPNAASYVLWAALMNVVFEAAFPLLPIAAWIVALQLVQAATYWATRSKFVQWAGSLGGYLFCCALALRRAGNGEIENFRPDRWPTLFDYSAVDYLIIVAIVIAAFGLSVAGISRQRRGDSSAAKPRTASQDGSPNWIDGLFRLPCPTTSATRAQLWFELKSSGLTILGSGLVAAIGLLALTKLAGSVESIRPFVISIPLLGALLVLVMGGNAFGIRRRQGWSYASVFDVTQAVGTGSLAGLKVFVRSVTVFVALGLIVASTWMAVPIVNEWPGVGREGPGLLRGREAIKAAVLSLTGLQLIALAILAIGAVVLLVTTRASIEALFARYRRRLIGVGVAILVYCFAFAVGQLIAGKGSWLSALIDAVLAATIVTITASVVLATCYLFWRTIAERLLTPAQLAGACLISLLFGAAWATMLWSSGLNLADLHPAVVVLFLLPVILPLTAFVLAPWSLSRIRHV